MSLRRGAAFLAMPFLLAATAAPAPFVPDLEVEGLAPLADGAWTAETPVYRVTLRQLDDAERQAFLAARSVAVDPFVSSGDQGSFMTFLIELVNTGKGTLSFDSQSCYLKGNDNLFRYPLDLPSMESSYSLLEKEMPAAYRQVRAALLDGALFLEPGRRASGLLVYPAFPDTTKRFRLEARVTTTDGATGRLVAAYRRAKPQKR